MAGPGLTRLWRAERDDKLHRTRAGVDYVLHVGDIWNARE